MSNDGNRPNIFQLLSILGLTGAFVLLYWDSFPGLLKRWSTSDFSHCYLVPFIALYFAYDKKQKLLSQDLKSSIWGWSVIVCSGILFIAGKLGSLETVVYASIWLTIVGIIFSTIGWRGAMSLAYPLAILAFIVPLPGFLNQFFTFKLKLLATDIATTILTATGVSVFRSGNIVDLPTMQLQIVDACSGLHYIYSLFLLGMVLAYFRFRRWPGRLILIACTIPLAVFANSLRIVGMGWLSHWMSKERLEGLFHDTFGIFVFVFTTLALLLLSVSVKFVIKPLRGADSTDDADSHSETGKGSMQLSPVIPAGAAVLMLLFWGLHVSTGTVIIKPPRLPFSDFPQQVGEWQGKPEYLDKEILKSLWADDYVQMRFHNRKTEEQILLFAPYYEYQTTFHTAHAPVACFLGSGWSISSREMLERDFPPDFHKVRVRQMLLESTGQRLLVNYWFQGRGRIIASEYSHKWHLFWDALTRRRNDGALVRVEMMLRPGQDLESAQRTMDSFNLELQKVMPEYVPN